MTEFLGGIILTLLAICYWQYRKKDSSVVLADKMVKDIQLQKQLDAEYAEMQEHLKTQEGLMGRKLTDDEMTEFLKDM